MTANMVVVALGNSATKCALWSTPVRFMHPIIQPESGPGLEASPSRAKRVKIFWSQNGLYLLPLLALPFLVASQSPARGLLLKSCSMRCIWISNFPSSSEFKFCCWWSTFWSSCWSCVYTAAFWLAWSCWWLLSCCWSWSILVSNAVTLWSTSWSMCSSSVRSLFNSFFSRLASSAVTWLTESSLVDFDGSHGSLCGSNHGSSLGWLCEAFIKLLMVLAEAWTVDFALTLKPCLSSGVMRTITMGHVKDPMRGVICSMNPPHQPCSMLGVSLWSDGTGLPVPLSKNLGQAELGCSKRHRTYGKSLEFGAR